MTRPIDSITVAGMATGLILGLVGVGVFLLPDAQAAPGARQTASIFERQSIQPEPLEPIPAQAEPPRVEAEPPAAPIATIRVADIVRARPVPPIPADTGKLAVSRIFVSEAGWEAEGDHRAIFGVLANIRRRNESWLHVARRASPRATGVRPNRRPRGRMIATLLDSDARPAGWIRCRRGRPLDRCNGAWGTYIERWRRVRQLAAELVHGAPIESPCPGRPIAWGGWMDDWLAERRGLERIECRAPADSGGTQPTLNRFWIRPSGT